MSSGELILGVHVSQSSKVLNNKKTKSMSAAISRDMDALSLNAAQIFVMGPRNFSPVTLDKEDIQEVCKDIDLTVHSAYTTVGIWQVRKYNKSEKESKTKLTHFANQLKLCKEVGAWGMVLHISKVLPEDVANTMSLLKPLAKESGVKILLEMVASKACDKTYETPEKLDNLITLLGINESYYGLTIDTAHIWAAGVDIRKRSQMSKWLNDFVHKKKIAQIHLNGSSTSRGSGKDKHAIAFSKDDVIWHDIKPEESGLCVLVEYAVKNSIPMICEINVGDESATVKSLNIIKTLAGL